MFLIRALQSVYSLLGPGMGLQGRVPTAQQARHCFLWNAVRFRLTQGCRKA